jgi:antitoxin Phd
MIPSYSVAEARNRFAEILHDLERFPRVEATRRGRPVAVLISIEEYERLQGRGRSFWGAYSAFREALDLPALTIEPAVFEGVRETSPGREPSW